MHGVAEAEAVALCVQRALQEVLPDFSVDPKPRLQGCWRSVPRMSLTQSSTAMDYASVQLEIGYRLRRTLGRDARRRLLVVAALAACEQAAVGFLGACQSGSVGHPHMPQFAS